MSDSTTTAFDSIAAYRWIRARLGTPRTPRFGAESPKSSFANAHLDCFIFLIALPMLVALLLMGGLSAVEWGGVLGLLTGYVLALVAGRVRASEEDGEESASPDQLSENVKFGVLKNRRRREALRYLRRAGGRTSLRNLAEYVAAEENDTEADKLTSAQRKRVYTTLYQCHLPMMDDEGILEYNQNRGRVELLDAASELFEHIDETEAERRWDWASLGLAVIPSLFVAIALLTASPRGGALLWSWGVLSGMVLLVVTLVSGKKG